MAESKKRMFLRWALILGTAICCLSVGIALAGARQNQRDPSKQDSGQTPQQVLDTKLAAVNRIRVDSFGDDATAKQLQAMIINALAQTKKFVILDEPNNNPDATLRGAALATTSGESKPQAGRGGGGAENDSRFAGRGADASPTRSAYQERPGSVGTQGGPYFDEDGPIPPQGKGQGGRGGAKDTGGADAPPAGSAAEGGRGGGQGSVAPESGASPKSTPISIASADTVLDVSIAVRLVAQDGDIIWTCNAESKGANGKGPIEDAANIIVAQLLSDLAKLPPPASPPAAK